jgi:hypothetical protein
VQPCHFACSIFVATERASMTNYSPPISSTYLLPCQIQVFPCGDFEDSTVIPMLIVTLVHWRHTDYIQWYLVSQRNYKRSSEKKKMPCLCNDMKKFKISKRKLKTNFLNNTQPQYLTYKLLGRRLCLHKKQVEQKWAESRASASV